MAERERYVTLWHFWVWLLRGLECVLGMVHRNTFLQSETSSPDWLQHLASSTHKIAIFLISHIAHEAWQMWANLHGTKNPIGFKDKGDSQNINVSANQTTAIAPLTWIYSGRTQLNHLVYHESWWIGLQSVVVLLNSTVICFVLYQQPTHTWAINLIQHSKPLYFVN